MSAPSRLLLQPLSDSRHGAADPAAGLNAAHTGAAAGPISRPPYRSQAMVAREIHARGAPYDAPADLALAVLRRRLRRIERRTLRAVFVGTKVGGELAPDVTQVDVDGADGRRARAFLVHADGRVRRVPR
ncbi:MAG: hypothetical protein IT537_08555 [Hyphomicrobiales bacterium]|nr:hypothetical protein [Hyphomicrobiales bacterium]